MVKSKILLTIAARGGSKGVKNKNIRDLCGKPLIAYSIDQAKRWGKADKIICSTDSPDIASIAKKNGIEVPFMRPAELAGDLVGKIEVLRNAWLMSEKIYGEKYDVLIDLDATAPIRKISDIEGAYNLFIEENPKTVFSVTHSRRNPYFNMVEALPDGSVSLVKKLDSSIKRRQDAPKVFDLNASIYVYSRDYLLDEKTTIAISDRSLVWIMDDLSAIDIDAEIDFQFIEFLIKKGLVNI